MLHATCHACIVYAGQPYQILAWNLFEGLALIATTFTFHVALYSFTYRLDDYADREGGILWNVVIAIATVVVNAICVAALGYDPCTRRMMCTPQRAAMPLPVETKAKRRSSLLS